MPRVASPARTARPHLEHEIRLRAESGGKLQIIVGIDEAGRGAQTRPVVAAAVALPADFTHQHLHDSKKLSAARRASIYRELTTNPAISWACATLEPAEIDRLNILRATHEAMRRALLALPIQPDHALIDGLPVEPFPVPHTALVEGDAISLSIAAASVVAKVTRDRIMEEWDVRFPAYGFSKHKGYSTSQHLAILARDGPCPIHRYSFRPVAEPHLAFAAYGTASAAGLARRKRGGEVPSAEGLQGALPPLPAAGPQG